MSCTCRSGLAAKRRARSTFIDSPPTGAAASGNGSQPSLQLRESVAVTHLGRRPAFTASHATLPQTGVFEYQRLDTPDTAGN